MLLVQAPNRLNTLDDVRECLQKALELEHATIPPYLFALFSIKRNSRTRDAITRIEDVAFEEMMHMTLVCNILNAIGGVPRLAFPEFVPDYPSPLPMGIGGDVPNSLVIPLKRYSKETVKDVFMAIEQPEDPQEFPVVESNLALTSMPHFQTIGQFYESIANKIEQLGDSIFLAEPPRQVDPNVWFNGLSPGRVPRVISDVTSAKAAITAIVEQGEGTGQSPEDTVTESSDDYAHYYKFEEIYRGLALTESPTGGHQWGPKTLRVAEEVYPFADNPKMANVDANSDAGKKMREFNLGYTNLLKRLGSIFSEGIGDIGDSLGDMYGLSESAEELAEIVEGDSTAASVAGPSFEWFEA